MKVSIKEAAPSQHKEIGNLMVDVYSRLEGFPGKEEQPAYYDMLANVGQLTGRPGVTLLVAVTEDGQLVGAVVYFSDMRYYGSGGTATQEKNAAGFRLLAVHSEARGEGVGKLLTSACIQRARSEGQGHVVIHTTRAMQTAWKMYESMGFKRALDLDFEQGGLPVFGFRLPLDQR